MWDEFKEQLPIEPKTSQSRGTRVGTQKGQIKIAQASNPAKVGYKISTRKFIHLNVLTRSKRNVR